MIKKYRLELEVANNNLKPLQAGHICCMLQ